MSSIEEPLDLIRLALAEHVEVKCKSERVLTGKLHAYDAHLNLVLGDVEEISLQPSSEEDPAAQPVLMKRNMGMLFVRGDGIILISTSKSSNV